jgi:hypothetical protein
MDDPLASELAVVLNWLRHKHDVLPAGAQLILYPQRLMAGTM